MKKFIILTLFSGTLFSQPKKFTIDAVFKGTEENSWIFLNHKLNDVLFTDSAKVKQEKVRFEGQLEDPNLYWISSKKSTKELLIFFVDGGKIQITANIDSINRAIVKAGKTQEDYVLAMSKLNAFNTIKTEMIARYQICTNNRDQECVQKILDSAKLSEKTYINSILNFIKKNPESNVGGYLIFSSVFDFPTIAIYDTLYNALSAKVKKGKFGTLAKQKVNSLKGTTIGYPAIDFSQADQNGKNISLSSLKGKVVLVDFWASWCGPCRAENPNVVLAYKKYHNKGFEILGVSFDENKDKWLKAVEKDGLTWPQVSDLKGWQNAAGKIYGVTSIPFNLLLDKEGKILGKGLRGPELEAALVKIFGE